MDSNQINADILVLSDAWYQIVGRDHHKDRDCHWTVTIDYAYGQAPVFRGEHAGYCWKMWTGPKRATLVEALGDVRGALIEAISDHAEWAERALGDPDNYFMEEADIRDTLNLAVRALGEAGSRHV